MSKSVAELIINHILNFNENETFAGFEESSAKERKQRRNFSKITNEYLEVR